MDNESYSELQQSNVVSGVALDCRLGKMEKSPAQAPVLVDQHAAINEASADSKEGFRRTDIKGFTMQSGTRGSKTSILKAGEKDIDDFV